MAAFATSGLPHPHQAAVALLAIWLIACSAPRAPQPILAERCSAVSAAWPITIRVASAGGGTLRIAIRQRGISLTATLIDGAANANTVSPVERYGQMTLIAASRQARSYTVKILSRDSPDITGDACIATELVDQSDWVRLTAERAFANGGAATRARRWQAAFDDYLTAAREFDHLDRQRSAEARQAMAHLAYLQLDRKRDSYALAQRALADFGSNADEGMRSALTQLQATIVAESKGAKPDTRRERASQLLDISGALAKRARFGAREFPRLRILRGFLDYTTGNSAVAAASFAQAAAECKVLRDWECYARARMNGAGIAEETGNNAVALQGYAEALQNLSSGVEPSLTADIWDNLGRLQGYIGLFTLAERSQLKAIRLYAGIDDCDGVRRALSTLGSILVHVGNIDDALGYLRLATVHECSALLSITRAKTQDEFHSLGAVADAKFDTGAAAHAACDNPPAPATLSAEGEIAVFRALLALNYGATLDADHEVAQRCLAAAKPYALTARLQLRLANATGSAYVESDEPARARESFIHALDIADRAGLAATHQNRAQAYLGLAQASLLAHQHGEALRFSAQALRLGSTRADVGQVVSALRVLAMSLREAGERQRARQTLGTAVNLIEQIPIDDLDAETRTTYLATQHGIFEELIDLLAEDAVSDHAAGERSWAAFAAAERGRARSLQYAISQATDNDPLNVRAHSAAQYQGLLARIATAAATADTAAGWRSAVEQLEHLSAAARETPAPVDAGQLLSQLDRLDATLVAFATGRNDMFSFVIDGGDIHLVPLGDRNRIRAAATDFYERLHDPEGADKDIRRAARRLAELALWPVTRYVHRGRVIFIADDSLHTIPFALLPWSQDPQSPLVLQQAESAVVPSALFITQHPHAPRVLSGAPRFELIGDPIFQATDWRRECFDRALAAPEPVAQQTRSASDWSESVPRLPGSRAEVLAIADLARAAWPSSHIGVHLGCMATPATLREAANTGPDLLHIATHGYVDALRPRLSALALSRESALRSTGGVFSLLDILDAKTTSRFVVLSACDTSRGRLLAGEGLMGLAQAFLQSGATSVVASYWRIDDAATVSFMRTFYKYLLTERLPVATALRRAQLEQLPAGAAHNWAAFALFGWPDSSL